MTTSTTMDTPSVTRLPQAVGSRAQRMSHPSTIAALRDMAIEHGVCIRPQPLRQTDAVTGRTEVIDVACGATQTRKCPSCAKKAKRMRQVQCREGWHRADEPIQPQPANDNQQALITCRAKLEFARSRAEQLGEWDQANQHTAEIEELDQQITLSGLRGAAVRPVMRRVRSTRRRQDTPNLPRRRIVNRTVGQAYTGRDGKQHRPSMFLTLTLPSYGAVRRADSTPVDMDSYDYRRAALDAVHFPALLDRFWQNLRRAIGWKVQYFGCVEPQKRLAPHAHYAARGTFPRHVFRQVAAGTYHQVWQPSTDLVVFGEDGPQPHWLDQDGHAGYRSPWTGQPLPTWEQAKEALDEQIEAGEVGPVHVIRFGEQVHAASNHNEDQGDSLGESDGGGFGPERRMGVEGITAGTDRAEKAIGYITKYITKTVDECHTRTTQRQIEHHRRFYEALRFTPCSERCANWLRYGIQPKHARPDMVAGRCRGRVHQPNTLGIGGRRVLVSRDWSGKTLADHKADQGAWVRRLLALGLGHQPPQPNNTPNGGSALNGGQEADGEGQGSAVGGGRAGVVRVWWERADPRDRDVKPLHQRLWRNLGQRIRRRIEWQTVRDRLAAITEPPPAHTGVSATGPEGGRHGTT